MLNNFFITYNLRLGGSAGGLLVCGAMNMSGTSLYSVVVAAVVCSTKFSFKIN